MVIEKGKDLHRLGERLTALTTTDKLIATSRYAIEWAQGELNNHQRQWPDCEYYAVGPATASDWQLPQVTPIHLPEQHSSEGLLALPSLQASAVAGRRILLLRGNGGRELLPETLVERGARLEILEAYRRVYPPLDGAVLVSQWQQLRVNSVIISSGELLQRLCELAPLNQHHWLFSLRVIVTSSRIARLARDAGFKELQIASDASAKALADVIGQSTKDQI